MRTDLRESRFSLLINKLNDWVLIFLSTSIIIAVAALGWWDLIDGRVFNPVLEFGARSTLQTHMTEKLVYHPGEMVYARVLFQKNRPLRGILQWHLVNDEMRAFPPREGTLPVGIWDARVRVEVIPQDVTLNKDHWFCGTVTYRINWLATLPYSIWTNKFKVVRK